VLPLNVSGPFHTSLLAEAGTKLRQELEKVRVKDLAIPVIFNTTGNYQDGEIIDILEAQIQSSVYFEKSIRQMLADGVDCFIEVGASKVLIGFVKKIDRKATVYNLEDLASLNKILEAFNKEVIGNE
jgi:[acyl-carrier-protein] S-malonyltransferase